MNLSRRGQVIGILVLIKFKILCHKLPVILTTASHFDQTFQEAFFIDCQLSISYFLICVIRDFRLFHDGKLFPVFHQHAGNNFVIVWFLFIMICHIEMSIEIKKNMLNTIHLLVLFLFFTLPWQSNIFLNYLVTFRPNQSCFLYPL